MDDNSEMRNKELERSILKNIVDAYAYCKVLSVENSIINDWVFVEINEPFEKLVGLKEDQLLEKRMTQILPDISTFIPLWISMCSKAVNEKEEVRYEEYREQSDKWYSVKVYSNNPGFFIMIYHDITELKRGLEELRYLNFHDKLTGLYNREFFEEELCRLNTERQLPLSIVIGSINGLKLINNAFGGMKGNDILKKTAELLKTSCRKEDIISRIGGDEFAVILPKTSKKDASQVCSRLRNKCKEASSGTMQISLALGLSTKHETSQKIETVYKEAEAKMQNNKLNEWSSVRSSIIKFLIKLLDERTHETEAHAMRIKQMALKMGRTLEVSDACLDELVLLAILHDIGKIAIPDAILCKSIELTDEEWLIMKKHSEIGYRIAISSYELTPIADYILYHHENWDGSGYPHGLKNEDIPLVSRIIRVIDSYDAMTNDRSYHKAISKKEAVEELKSCSGKQFDPKIVDVFVNMLTEQ